MVCNFFLEGKFIILKIMKVAIIAHPNSKNPRVETDLLGTMHVYVSAPPLEGKANKAVIEALAEHFKASRRKIILVGGEKSKNKLFEILAE
jgi:hypothetical protein